MNILCKKIKQEREKKGYSLSELSKITNLPKSNLQRYETATTKKIPIEAVALIEKALNLPVGYLMGWNQSNTEDIDLSKFDNIRPVELRKFPMLGEIACGEPITCNEEYETYFEASADINADFCLIAKGDSMINSHIMDGDVVFIHKQPMVENGEIAAVVIDNEATLKRLFYYKEENKLLLMPENPKYAPIVYINNELDNIQILGKAVAHLSLIK